MHKLILLGAVCVITAALLFTTTPISAQDEGKDCNLIASICRTLSDNLYSLCMATRADTGKSASDCTWDAALYTINCMNSNGCPLGN